MENRVLRYFVAVAELGSITDGARAVRISQPAVSRQLKALEDELGVALFDRGHGALSLTHAGARFYHTAKDLIRREAMARASVRLNSYASDQKLLVVAPLATIMRCLAPFIAERGHSLPLIDGVEAEPMTVFEKTTAIGADLGISTVPAPAGWSSRLLCSVGVVAQVPPGNPLFERDFVTLTELVKYRLILMDGTNSARTVIDAALADAELQAVDPIEMSSSLVAQALAAAGRGVAILTNSPAFGLRAVRIMHQGRQVRMGLYAGWDGSHYAADSLERLTEDFADWLTTLPEINALDEVPAGA